MTGKIRFIYKSDLGEFKILLLMLYTLHFITSSKELGCYIS